MRANTGEGRANDPVYSTDSVFYAVSIHSATPVTPVATPMTIFAPTDAAFDAMDAETRAVLTSGDAEKIRRLVQFHVAKGKVTLDELAGEVNVNSHAPWWGKR